MRSTPNSMNRWSCLSTKWKWIDRKSNDHIPRR